MSKGKKHPGSRPDRRRYPLMDISFAHLLGELVMAWNNTENCCRMLLNHLLGQPNGVKSVTNELNGQSLWFALRALASSSAHPEIEPHIREISVSIERLNEHRNYFVHGAKEEHGSFLILRTEYAKGEIREYEDKIDKQEMHQLIRDCEDMGMCALNIIAYLMLKRQDPLTSLPEMPFLPPQLDKTRRNPKARVPTPSSSPE